MQTILVFQDEAFDIALIKSGIRTSTELATRIGYSRARISLLRKGYVPSEKVRRLIASTLGLSIDELWRTLRISSLAV